MTKECHFTDRKGREWDLTLDLRTCKYVDSCDFSELTGEKFSILRPEKKLFWRFIEDSGLLFAVVWAIVIEQAQEKFKAGTFPCSPKEDPKAAELEFVSGINGKARNEGKQAFLEALMDFFPEQRTVLSAILDNLSKMRKKIDQKVTEVEPLMEEMAEMEMDTAIEKLRQELQKNRETAGAIS